MGTFRFAEKGLRNGSMLNSREVFLPKNPMVIKLVHPALACFLTLWDDPLIHLRRCELRGFPEARITPTNVAPIVILEDEDYGLKVSINMKITGSGSSALPEYSGFGC